MNTAETFGLFQKLSPGWPSRKAGGEMPATNALECQTVKSAGRQQPDSPLNEEQDLIVQARNGSPAAIELLVSRYENRIFRLARNITANYEDAEEVVQNAFAKAFQNLAT